MQTLSGFVTKILFHNDMNGYTVLELKLSDKSTKVIAVGHGLSMLMNQEVQLNGQWQTHPKHGQQFLVSTFSQQSPTFSYGRFLIQHIDGIGPSFAQRIQQTFGDKISDILEKEPHRLKEVPGIGEMRYKRILESWQKQTHSRDIMVFLTTHQFGPATANKIYRHYGEKTIERLQEDPYRLLQEIEGIGFQVADGFAQRMGMQKNDSRRIGAGIITWLHHEAKQGHCGSEQERLVQGCTQLLGIQADPIREHILQMVAQKQLSMETVKGQACLFLRDLWQQEKEIAQKLKVLRLIKSPLNYENLQKALQVEIQKEALSLSEEQQIAIQTALNEKVFVLTGGPGVGKTTLIRLLVKVYSHNQCKVALCAPTGRAAKRLSEVTHTQAKTIHRLLEYDPVSKKFSYNAFNTLPYDVVIIDEASMLDVPLTSAVLQAIPPTAKVLLVGDVDQLPSVGPGDVLGGIIRSAAVPTFALKTIFRQQHTSQIILNAHRVNQGIMPVMDETVAADFYLVKAATPEDHLSKVIRIVNERLPQRFGFNPMEDIQILTPMNDGALGVNSVNQHLQQTLNPPAPDKPEIQHFDGVLRQGDKVIQIVNNYDKNVFNGDIGKVLLINEQARKIIVLFDTPIEYSFKDLSELKLAYAISIHKSQGSEYPAVVVLLSKAQSIMLRRNLLYTAMTRGKSCVVIVSDQVALGRAVQHYQQEKRMSKLEEWLQDAS